MEGRNHGSTDNIYDNSHRWILCFFPPWRNCPNLNIWSDVSGKRNSFSLNVALSLSQKAWAQIKMKKKTPNLQMILYQVGAAQNNKAGRKTFLNPTWPRFDSFSNIIREVGHTQFKIWFWNYLINPHSRNLASSHSGERKKNSSNPLMKKKMLPILVLSVSSRHVAVTTETHSNTTKQLKLTKQISKGAYAYQL